MPTRDEFAAEIKVETARVERKIWEYARECDKTVQEVLPGIAKSFVKEVIKLTPPLEKLSATESWATQKKIGMTAVEIDIKTAFVPLDQLGIFRQPQDVILGRVALKALRSGTNEELADLLERAGYRNVRPDRIIEEPTEELHDPLRGSRGKVLRSRKASYFVRKTAKLKAFIRKKQKLVGKLKAGWLAAADKLGISVPNWIRQHMQAGGIVDKSMAKWNPHIRIWNSVSYAQRQNQDLRYVAIALRNQAGKLARQLEAKMKGLWEGRGAE